MKSGPLAGKTVLVTRAKEQAHDLSRLIERQGGEAIEVPLIEFQSTNFHQVQKVLNELQDYQWLIFTSTNGVRFFMEQVQTMEQKLNFTSLKIAVVGEKTEEMLERFGLKATVIPKEYVAEGLVEALMGKVKKGERVIVARGNLGRVDLVHQLSQMGAMVTDLFVYETVCPIKAKEQLHRVLQVHKQLDYITFTSSSTVRHYIKLFKLLKHEQKDTHPTVACIGPIAARTAVNNGLNVTIVPHTYTIEHLVEQIVIHSRGGKLS
ncbi:uroporphyrinogen-III synthase [Halalkalibacter alkaliphilus]|uniref:Uroporphyrinogen-III synthase n=1 Tax=Halalkalibacter alkaliphilus TaxID=2917993 RepID=A0A9X2CTZ0_9BACI|nr:uroporphyrinogen-III synthase [Halalkalibacter alkaliphilus]MCL7748085.1 uroporphyrinogen-III synthase [Halalkalibacter alkaliphilus]